MSDHPHIVESFDVLAFWHQSIVENFKIIGFDATTLNDLIGVSPGKRLRDFKGLLDQ